MGCVFQTADKSRSASRGRRSLQAPAITRQPGPASQGVPHPKAGRCACGGSCPRCQAKSNLKIGAPDDAYEREADTMADRVMRMAGAAGTIAPMASGGRRKCTACEKQDEAPLLQSETAPSSVSAQDNAAAAPSSVVEALTSPGQALDFNTRAFFEPRFGRDFSGVRVHSGAAAELSARDLSAHAYTVGSDIVFGARQFAPRTIEGKSLLAHELAHTVQQSAAGRSDHVQRKVVDDDTHVTCRATRADAVARLKAGEQTAATFASQAATAIRAYVPSTNNAGETAASRTFRDLVWRRFQLDYNETQARCVILPELADRFDKIAKGLAGSDHTYRCGAAGIEPPESCTTKPGEGVAWSTGRHSTDICESSWSDTPDEFADTIMHEWFHSIFKVSDCGSINLDNAACYPTFARELAGTATSADQATCCQPPAGPLPALSTTAEAAGNCSAPSRVSLEIRAGGASTRIPAAGADPSRSLFTGAVSLGLRYRLRPERLIVFNPSLGAHLVYLPSGGDRGDHLAAFVAEFGARFQPLRVPLRGVYVDLTLGGFAGVNIPQAAPAGLPPRALTAEVGGTASLGFGYRTERIEIGLQVRDMLGTSGTNNLLILGGGAVTF